MQEPGNPLLLEWVTEMLNEANEHGKKSAVAYRKARDSLKACPKVFEHPSEAKELIGIGDKLATILTKRMEAYCKENGLPPPKMAHRRKKKRRAGMAGDDNEEDEEDDAPSPPKKKPRKLKPYVPALRSGAYAIILALAKLEKECREGISKQEIIAIAQKHCDSDFIRPSDPGKFYTAWKSMDTLQDKELVYVKGRPTKRYLLTDDGWDVANRILASSNPANGRQDTFTTAQPVRDNDNDFDYDGPSRSNAREKDPSDDLVPQGETISDESALPSFRPIILEPGSFTIELVLDNREVFSTKDRGHIQDELIKQKIKHSTRALGLGDVLWIAKMHDPNILTRRGVEGDEIMLDYILERKRLDDLIGSIKDGRFHEQKFRLKRSGINNVIYLVEEKAINADTFGKYEEAVESAIASTMVVNGYFVKRTEKMDDTIRYLVSMTKLLKEKYESKPLHLIPTNVLTVSNYLPLLKHLEKTKPSINHHITFTAFSSLSSKSETLTLRDIYLKMLMCTRGVTGEKALEIQKRWKTPREFVEAFERVGGLTEEEKKKMRGDLVSGQMGNLVGRKKIAKALSVKIAEVWGARVYEG